MERTAFWLAAIALCGIVSAKAAGMEKASVYRVYNDTVTPAAQQAYENAVKTYNKCLAAHGSKTTWTAWLHETGDTYTYSYISGPATWANFDAMRAADKACDASWRENANPHLKSEISEFVERMPELSHMNGDGEKTDALMEVTFYTLKGGHEVAQSFRDAVKKITAAAEKSGWPGNYMTLKVVDGGQGVPDYIVASYSKNWADFGKENDQPFWKMVEGVYGKSEADALLKSLNDDIKEMSSHIDRRSAELTYTPAGK